MIDLGRLPTAGRDSMTAVCQAEAREGMPTPVDMYFLVDSSGSMGEVVSGGSKWEVVSDALVSFLNNSHDSTHGVGIGYFPAGVQTTCVAGDPGCLCIPIINICLPSLGGSCMVADYASPAVPIALPANVAPVVASITGHQLSGGTPTRPAFEGALQYLSTWADAHPDRKPVLVLASDGEPTGCDRNTPQDVANLASMALAGPRAIQTFVIGVGRSLTSLNLIARAGGTGDAYLVDTGGDVGKQFAEALDRIRGEAASCDFIIPAQGSDGMPVNPSKINVRYTASGATTPTLVAQTFGGDPNNCGTAGGWYYDNPQAPTLVKLCDTTCEATRGARVEVEFGCDTIVQPPR